MAFSSPAPANAYSPHTGLSSMVLQRKRSQGRTGHMIILISLMNNAPNFQHLFTKS